MAALQTDTAMTKAPVLLALIVAALTLTACSREETPAKSGVDTTEVRNELAARAGAPLFEGMGRHHHPNAQRYFNQGHNVASNGKVVVSNDERTTAYANVTGER